MRKQSAFTIIELMIAMAIIAVLVTAGISAYVGYLKKGRDTARVSIANQVNTAVNALMGSNGGIPPTATELIAELDRMNMTTAMNSIIPQEPLYLSTLSDTLGNLIGAPALFGQTIREPSGGKPICIGYNSSGTIIGGQSCAFRYIVYGDNTYVIGYGVEHESSLKKNFYRIDAPTAIPNTPAPFFMQVVGTAEYVGIPSIGEADGPAPAATTSIGSSKVTIITGGEVQDTDLTSVIVTVKSAPLSTDYIAPGSIGDNEQCINNADCSSSACINNLCDPCSGTCTEGQICGSNNTCIDLCNGLECGANQQCVNDVCTDLCGGVVCTTGQVCSAGNACVAFCGGVECTVGQVCSAENACVAFCGGVECTVGQVCGASNTCIDLCGGMECGANQMCVSDVCTDLCGSVTCGVNQVCVSDVCTDLCGSVTCGANQGCVSDVCTDLCGGNVCGVNQVCVSDVCTDLCGSVTCGANQTCVSNVCTDLCGGNVCVTNQTCVNNVCVYLDPCGGKTIGQACDGTTAKSAGTYNGYKYMTTPSDLGSSITWGPDYRTYITGTDGSANTAALLALTGKTYPAARDCYNLVNAGFDDWFLPSKPELVSVLQVNNALIGGFTSGTYYWSSTEVSTSMGYGYAEIVQFPSNYPPNQWGSKSYPRSARCVRKY